MNQTSPNGQVVKGGSNLAKLILSRSTFSSSAPQLPLEERPSWHFRFTGACKSPQQNAPTHWQKQYGSVEFLFVCPCFHYLIWVKKLPIISLSLCVILGNATWNLNDSDCKPGKPWNPNQVKLGSSPAAGLRGTRPMFCRKKRTCRARLVNWDLLWFDITS